MKRLTAAAAVFFVLATSSAASEGVLSARRIMKQVEERDDGDRSTRRVQMVLTDRAGATRLRELRGFSQDHGPDITHQLMFFDSPANVKDTGFLTYDYDDVDRDDEQWLYLPALHKSKRIASSDRSGSFMGSDFAYSDLTSRALDRYDYRILKQDQVAGRPVWVIEAVPRTKKEADETGYTNSVLFVRIDNFVVVRAVHWLKLGGRLKYMDVKRLEQIDGIWTATEIHMTTKKGRVVLHKTVMTISEVRFDQDLPEQLFTLRYLERGF